MSILFEAWHRARGGDSRLAETLGAPPPPGGGRRRSVLLPWLLAFVLAAVAAGLGVYLWRIERAPVRRPAKPAVSANGSAAVRSVAPPLSKSATTASAGQARVGSDVPAAVAGGRDTVALPGVATPLPTTAEPSHRSDVAATAPAYVATSAPVARATSMPSAAAALPGTGAPSAVAGSTVPADVRAALPALNVMVHVWNTDPDRRFVVINGHIFHAGDEVASGVKLVEITRDGEVVSFRGYRIDLPGS